MNRNTYTLLLILGFFSACSSNMQRKPFQIQTGLREAPARKSILLAAPGAVCEKIAEKRIVHVLYSLPVNQLQEPANSSNKKKARRYTRTIKPLDILYTALGFMFSITTHTEVIEACESRLLVLTPEELQVRLASRSTSSVAGPANALARMASSETVKHIHDIYFPTNKSRVSEKEQAKLLGKWHKIIMKGRFERLLILGQSDSRGSSSYNLKLGIKRAENVKSFLIRAGIDAQKITTVTAGENLSKSGVKKSERRVQLVFVMRK